jgi:hypothetical protein
MIVDVVNIEGFAFFESKDDSPVSAYRHGPESRKLASQPMKAKTRQCHVLNSYGGVQDTQDQPKSLFVLRPDPGVTSGFVEFPQALMGKAANHKFNVTNNVIGYKRKLSPLRFNSASSASASIDCATECPWWFQGSHRPSNLFN